ncbi:hypothetical protein [Marinimicrobium alkaliphilum]|uniref:hypothetical protein n=1 Tax=Marinimicrobium alkaliphilum TaxID=2202654 RepID=UPI000DBA5930|nr:hypothetical protein [Marinimicrobium alkaliphilum]
MKTVEFLALGLRLVGIYAFLKGIQNIALVFSQAPIYHAQNVDFTAYYLVSGILVALYFAVALLLVIRPVWLAQLLMPKVPVQEDATPDSSYSALQTAALTVLGVYIVSYSLPQVVHNLALFWQATTMVEYYSQIQRHNHGFHLLARCIELGIGIYLCLQAKGLVNLLQRLRGRG